MRFLSRLNPRYCFLCHLQQFPSKPLAGCHPEDMKSARQRLKTLATSLLLCTADSRSPGQRLAWRPASNTARSITGDISLGEEKIIIKSRRLSPWSKPAPSIKPRSAPASTQTATPPGDAHPLPHHHPSLQEIPEQEHPLRHRRHPVDGHLRLRKIPPARLLLQPESPPFFTFAAISNSTDRCGTFSYVK